MAGRRGDSPEKPRIPEEPHGSGQPRGPERVRGPEKAPARPPHGPQQFERPVGVTPERARDGMRGVRDRAEAAFRERQYEAAVLKGEVKREIMKARVDAQLESNRKPRRKTFINREILQRLHERSRAFRAKREERVREFKRMRDEARKDMQRYLDVRRAEMFTVLTARTIPLGDTDRFKTEFGKLDDAVPENFENLKKQEQIRYATVVVQQFGVAENPEYVRAVLLDYEKQKADVAFAEQALNNDQFSAALVASSQKNDDAEVAFAQALQEAPPELQQAYEVYLQVWRSEEVSDVFAPPPPFSPGGENVEVPAPESSEAVAEAISQKGDGVTFHIGDSNLGEIHFGDIARYAAVFQVDGEPKVFIYDRNAERGVRGPIEPEKVRDEMAYVVIDEYFSEKFREHVGAGGENDPNKVLDVRLLEIVHALFEPGEDTSSARLDALQRRLVTNVAILFATPDPERASIEDKSRFFVEQIVLQPDRLANVRRMLREEDFSGKNVSLSEFGRMIPIQHAP